MNKISLLLHLLQDVIIKLEFIKEVGITIKSKETSSPVWYSHHVPASIGYSVRSNICSQMNIHTNKTLSNTWARFSPYCDWYKNIGNTGVKVGIKSCRWLDLLENSLFVHVFSLMCLS